MIEIKKHNKFKMPKWQEGILTDAVLVIGNGFDLSLGLKTSYSDFVKSNYFKKLLGNNAFADYLVEKPKLQRWIEIENQLSIYSVNEGKDNDSFLENFKEVSNALKAFLTKEQFRHVDDKTNQFKLFKKLKNTKALILDFNYTNTIALILQDLKRNEGYDKIEHLKIHGSLTDNQIIFGVEDKAKINLQHIFLKKSVSPHFSSKKFSITLKEANSILFFGHSLGKTDHMYFETFFRALTKDKIDEKELIIFHFGEKGYYQLMSELDSLTLSSIGNLRLNQSVTLIDTSKKFEI